MTGRTLQAPGAEVTVTTRHEYDYISPTDMVRHFGDESILYNWLHNRNTVEFLSIWEQIYNPDFKCVEFDRFRAQAGLSGFALTISARTAIHHHTLRCRDHKP
jgi:hypothetical protein